MEWIKRLFGQPLDMSPKWVNTADRMPSFQGQYLAVSTHRIVYATYYIKDVGFFPMSHSVSDTPIGVVTHWSVLPPLPKE